MLGTTPTVLEILVKAEVDDGFEFMTSMSLFRGAAVPAEKNILFIDYIFASINNLSTSKNRKNIEAPKLTNIHVLFDCS